MSRPGGAAPRGATFAFTSPAEAVGAMMARVGRVATERIPLERTAGRVLAEPVVADRPSPAADVSAMDGYAARLSDLTPGRHAVSGEVRIGREPPVLANGVVRIVTGSAVPLGADVVLKREDVRELGGAIEINGSTLAATKPGINIRRRGENIAAGAEVIGPGRVIDAAAAGALASFGVPEPLVFRRVRVGVLVTGDEVVGGVGAREVPTPWQLRDSNGPALAALVGGCAWAELSGPCCAVDELDQLRLTVESLLAVCDALLVTGGVSMGDRDFVPGALRAAGAEVLFHGLRQRPGKPVLGAISSDGKPVLALPGNPLSVMVTARRMAGPVLASIAGMSEPRMPAAVLVENAPDRRLGLWWHRPVRLVAPGRAVLVEGMGSGDLVSAARSDGFVELPPGEGGPGPWPFYPWAM